MQRLNQRRNTNISMCGNMKGRGITSLYSGQYATQLKNLLPNSDATGRPAFEGENHAILKLPNGRFGTSNFLGPGTHVVERIRRGDPPRTETDRVAQGHDLRYSLAHDVNDVRRADNKMISKVAEIAKKKTDNLWNINQARLISAKVVAEDIGFLKRDAFSGNLKKTRNASDTALLKNKLAQIEQEGYGKLLPVDRLKYSLLKKMVKSKKGGSLSPAGVSRGGSLSPAGVMHGAGIVEFLIKNVIPSILKSVNITRTIPVEILKTIITNSIKLIKNGSISSIVSHLSKTILPIIMQYMSGSGLRLAGDRRMRGKGLHIPSLSGKGMSMDALGKNKTKILAALSSGLKKKLTKYFKYKDSGKMKGKGYSSENYDAFKPFQREFNKFLGKSKGQTGGFFWLLPGLIALLVESISTVTVASVGAAAVTGMAGAAGAAIVKKIVGSGITGTDVQNTAKKVADTLKENKKDIVEITKAIGITQSDLPENVLDIATKTLESIADPSKENILSVVRILLPHVKKAFYSKLKSNVKTAQVGKGMKGKGNSVDSKILSLVSKKI